jgi:Tfp pilus assembly protein PilX
MATGPRSLRRDDRGAALPLVLAFIALVGTLTVALLGQASTNFRSARVSKDHQAKVYAAGSALDWTIQRLRADTTLCATTGGSSVVDSSSLVAGLGAGTADHLDVDVACSATGGGSSGARGWSVFTTGTSGATISTQSGNNNTAKQIGGPVYNSGGWDLQADLTVQDGFVRQATTGACGARPNNLVADPPVVSASFYQCTTPVATPGPLRDIAELTGGVRPPDAPAYTTVGSCRVFSPGRYTADLDLGDGTNYLLPGVYLLDNASLLVEKHGSAHPTVLGGATAAGQLPVDCRSAFHGANGVVLLLAGNSHVLVNDARLEIFDYYPNGPDGRPTQSVYQLESSPAGWNVDTSTPPPQDQAIATGSGSGNHLVVHGNVHASRSGIDLKGTGSGNEISFLGGVVARLVSLQASSSISTPLLIANQDAESARIVDITVTVQARNGADQPIGKPVVGVATVFIRNDAARTTSVSAWRVNEDLAIAG